MITIVALCGVNTSPDRIRINRKFHTGMCEYARLLRRPIACLLPRMGDEEAAGSIDLVEVPLATLPYKVFVAPHRYVLPADLPVLEEAIHQSLLLYCGPSEPLNWTVADLCQRHRVPYVVTTEYTLQTELDIMRASTTSSSRRWWRELKIRRAHRREQRLVRDAVEVHANGYPTFDELSDVNLNRVLFFDSRIRAADIIPDHILDQRLASLATGTRVPRLIYSGRYHPMKGALDVVLAGIELARNGVDFRLDLYGAGPLRDRMRDLIVVSHAADRIFVNDPVPFSPDLIEITRQCDLFLCCHVQGDPSCTYLETFASGVPIAGYENEMWSRLAADTQAGVTVPRQDIQALARAATDLLANPARLADLAHRAQAFASQHTMEKTWALRCQRIEAVALRTPETQPPD